MSPVADLMANDEQWMQAALTLAAEAAGAGEVPVGAILVGPAGVLGRGRNGQIQQTDPTAHAEIRALREAATVTGNYRLPGTTLYVTLEPCSMCAGALVHARIDRLVYGAREPKSGAVDSHALLNQAWMNHRVAVTGGVLEEACGRLLSDFFAARRASSNREGTCHE